jgi:hypothetical protein
MRLLALFLSTVAVVLGGVAAFNRQVDPFGDYYEGGILTAATNAARPCLIANDRIGPRAWLPFKEDIFVRRRARTVVVGSSRVELIGPWPGEKRFANLSIPETSPDTLSTFFARLHRLQDGPLTVYLGTELFWFNRNWRPGLPLFDSNPLAPLRDLLNAHNLKRSASIVIRSPSSLVDSWRKYRVGRRCVLDNSSLVAEGDGDAWAVDGTLYSRWQLRPDVPRPPSSDYTLALVEFKKDSYRDWHQLDAGRVAELDRALTRAESYGWRVVGLSPPYSTRFTTRLATAQQTAGGWRAYGIEIPRLFQRHGFAFVDLRKVSDVPCGEREFDWGNDGWHPDPACSMRVRRHLDEAAAQHSAAADLRPGADTENP